jgi:Xaa-Pro aminopeptidase
MKTKLIHEVRAVKSKGELANIIKAQRISERVLNDVLKNLRTNVTELAIAEFITNRFIKYDAPVLSFPPIVAFGKNTANIHHEPSKTKLKKGDIIMFDFGCTVNHYCSDMTRTYFWGKPSLRQKRVYEGVLNAMNLAIRKIETGERRCKIIDNIARNFLQKNFGRKSFPHGLGHGVGTVIHEWPNFKPNSVDVLPIGCVMTVEPGIYIKGKRTIWGGVRIEDMVLITKNGCQNLTKVSKDLNSVILIPDKV